MSPSEALAPAKSDFIRDIVAADVQAGKNQGRVITRFPPEPNGYLHIGHAKSICFNHDLAREYAPHSAFHLRFDDTNPSAEKTEYVNSIIEDVRWLGCDWGDKLFFASDYFPRLYDCACSLIEQGLAYVDDLSPQEMREHRGTLTEPGRDSPWRNRSISENLDLFARMRNGEFAEGERVLRAKIDMASPNLNLRDPVIYRIMRATHHRTGKEWPIYPMYDFAHPLEDAFEGVTHSICTLEFEDHRPFYDWTIAHCPLETAPRQIEFSRLNLTYMITSKRRLLKLVEENYVESWDDPRMPTISGMRRRGFPARAIRDFCRGTGMTKVDGLTDVGVLEHAVRDDLNREARRVMAVLHPLKVVLTNYPEEHEEMIECVNNPEDESAGTRQVPLSRELYIEREDFLPEAVKGWHRLSPGAEVRLRYGFCITCQEVIKDADGEVVELRCTYDEATRHGQQPAGRPKVKGIIHWVSARHSFNAEVRLYDRLFTVPEPNKDGETDFISHVNPESLTILKHCQLEPSLRDAKPETPLQFERLGYFCVDAAHARKGRLIFNRTIGLRDSWAKQVKK